MSAEAYVGSELEIFAHAVNWKRYWRSRIAPYLRGDVLEVGAGIGANTFLLRSLVQGRWTCLEPDPDLLRTCETDAASRGVRIEPRCGMVADLPEAPAFDTALYIDVLEHIEDDAGELAGLARRIRPQGHVIVLAPAHQKLHSPFDQAIGHFRRYDRRSLLKCAPAGWELRGVEYVDSFGYFLSFANRALLRQSMPTLRQILFWDRVIVPISRVTDRLTGFRFGKSILAVWKVG